MMRYPVVKLSEIANPFLTTRSQKIEPKCSSQVGSPYTTAISQAGKAEKIGMANREVGLG